ncbi:KTSC domain-containing protein [Candidatus Tokpelaia sp.]|uniref:KTSC domain-containing protein n=1 Tax=Candidatus Tokpelaia sp. TaxID=2233777 RepID=UPI00123C6800|nr:KTSC domain-containing protein [Candidatus Tokpelaia sp.]KAA6406021.1 KTSC domain-containing protein [Candidatus Tokpelaia sp.]
MDRYPINSGHIVSIGYENGILEVKFKDARIYQYRGVPEHVYRELMLASSKGAYLNKCIKGTYPSSEIR